MSISRISIQGLRGVDTPTPLELAPLNVFVGRNGVGKSTVIDALLLGSSQNPPDALGRVVRRRLGVVHGARWLLSRAGDTSVARATIRVEAHDGTMRESRLSLLDAPSGTLVDELTRRSSNITAEEIQSVRLQIDDGKNDTETRVTFEIAFEPRNSYAIRDADLPDPLRVATYVRLLDAKLIGEQLTDAFSNAVTSGRISDVVDILKLSEPSISNLQILTNQGQPYLAATVREITMPLALVGDGVRLLARLAFEIQSIREGGVLLVEEPELHQHPRAIRAISDALVAACRRGVQVVVTTHSLDMASAIKNCFDPAVDLDPEVALFAVERGTQGQFAFTRASGREIFLDANWGPFRQRFLA